ncbi:hypothetical protein BCR32DRAFT_329585 [Anaeromyces robustus]|uniref:Tubby C-terminal domain-containing protein n=1 Tax=Anaeromyces robustus TaxID=1754192 RepID=A0A1Y1WRS1_9FUNG|nr:hypothetical protein BCR32DRAFT_329585 [Anaeromyces robustus]|eukprot:ORX75956.1 hypothetical protein BCR32DRAFT_329585 [Anaeromyces robustus]
MGYYENQVKKEISKPPNEITVIDSAYVFQGKVDFTMEYQSNTRPSIAFKNSNGTTVYTANASLSKTTLYDFRKNPVLNVRKDESENYKFYTGNNTDNLIGETRPKKSWHAKKYTISCKNTTTNSDLTLDMNAENNYRSCGIFVGKEKNNAPMICKILKSKTETSDNDNLQFSIEISPDVDYLFMLALCLVFIEKYEKKYNKKEE